MFSNKSIFCLRPTAKVPSNYLSFSPSSGHLVNLLQGCSFWATFLGSTYGVNLEAGLGPVLALLLFQKATNLFVDLGSDPVGLNLSL